MKIVVFASGSGGNCTLISSGAAHLLIDAGISTRRLEASLRQAGLTVGDICGVLITHEHSDHIMGLKTLEKKYSVPIYAPRTVAARLRGMLPETDGQLSIIPVGVRTHIGCFDILPFHTPHDTDESVGYRIEGDGCFALATDMGCVTEEVVEALLGADTVLIESNHDTDMLSYGPYPVYLKRRILSDRGHLSNSDCSKLAAFLAENGTKKIILGHLSKENNRPEIALRETAVVLNGSAELYCAPPFGYLELESEEKIKCCL